MFFIAGDLQDIDPPHQGSLVQALRCLQLGETAHDVGGLDNPALVLAQTRAATS
jgi:hypothetical protein